MVTIFQICNNPSLKITKVAIHARFITNFKFIGGTLSQDKSYYIAMVQPLKSWICRLCSIQSRLMNIDHAKPGKNSEISQSNLI